MNNFHRRMLDCCLSSVNDKKTKVNAKLDCVLNVASLLKTRISLVVIGVSNFSTQAFGHLPSNPRSVLISRSTVSLCSPCLRGEVDSSHLSPRRHGKHRECIKHNLKLGHYSNTRQVEK